SLSSVHGMMPLSSSSPHVALEIPTGTIPKESGTSWFAQPTVATRSGLVSMTVSPRACSMVTGNWDSSAGLLDSESEPLLSEAAEFAEESEFAPESVLPLSEQADSASAAIADTAVRRTNLDVCTVCDPPGKRAGKAAVICLRLTYANRHLPHLVNTIRLQNVIGLAYYVRLVNSWKIPNERVFWLEYHFKCTYGKGFERLAHFEYKLS